MISITKGQSNYGIYCYYSKNISIYNNSLSIAGTSASSSALKIYYGNGGYKVMNNVLKMNGAGYAYYVSPGSLVSVSDYNDYYSTGNRLAYWNGNRNSLSALKTANGKDSHSKDANPEFFSTTDLHTLSINLNESAHPLAEVVADIDGDLRDTLHPDMGADEFTPPQYDAGIVSVDAPVQPLQSGNNVLKVTVKDYGTDTLTSVTVGWEANGVLQTPYSFSGSIPTGDTVSNIAVGNFTAVAGANTIKVWTSMPNGHNDQRTINDTFNISLTACNGPMNGVYTIGGQSADFVSFTEAVNSLNFCGINDTVEFVVNSGNYNEQIVLDSIAGTSDTAIVIFRSATLDSTDVKIYYHSTLSKNYVVSLNKAQYIHFRNITIEATNPSAGFAVTLNNKSSDNVFENCVITAPTSSNNKTAPVYSYNAQISRNTIRNNVLNNGYYGLRIYGANSIPRGNNNVIENNIVNNSHFYGLVISGQKNLIIKNNDITFKPSSNVGYGINLLYCDSVTVVSGNNIKMGSGTTVYGLRIASSYADSSNHALVYNNFISLRDGTSSNYGIYVKESSYFDVAFNNISVSQCGASASGLRLGSTSSHIRVFDNNIICTGSAYALYSEGTSALAASDFNNIYSTSSDVIKWGSTNYSSLSSYSAATGLDTNSLSVMPGYYSVDDLHITNPALYGAGVAFANIITDIDGDNRNMTTPCIGADEFTPLQYDVAAYAIVQPSASFAPATTTQSVEVTIRNFGMDTVTAMNLGYIYGSNNPVVESWSGSLLPGGTVNYTFSAGYPVQPGDVKLCVYTDLAQDMKHSNDTVCRTFTGIPMLNLSYFDDFDGSTNYWVSDGMLWQHGAPSQTKLDSAYSAPNAWMTGLSSNYTNQANTSLMSPFFNVATVNDATLKFRHKYRIGSGDRAIVEYTTDQGQTWALLGYMGDPAATNWYNKQTSGNHYFGGNHNGWMLSTYDLSGVLNPVGGSHPANLQFRFRFISNSSGNDEGWLIDDFSIELPKIQFDAGVSQILTPDSSVAGGDTIKVKVVVNNYGFDTLYTIPVGYSVNNQTSVNDTIVVSQGLLPGDTMHYVFDTAFISPVNDYSICAYTGVTGDVYNQNDTTCKTVKATTPLVDAGILRILSPSGSNVHISNDSVTVRIINYGITPLTSVKLQYEVAYIGGPVTEVWTGPALQHGDSVEYTFKTKYSAFSTYNQICAKTLVTGDVNPINDEYCDSFAIDGLSKELTNGMKLWQNIPNPATGKTKIKYEIPVGGSVRFVMVNAMGEKITEFVENKGAGVYFIDINTASLANGIYFYSIEFDGHRLTKQMIINK
jgi:hypothetical protein